MMPKGSKPWNKDTSKGWMERGYRVIWLDGKKVREHRHIMEQHLGRKLRPDELVHHKNGIQTDNRIENLEVTTWSDHATIHNNGSKLEYRTKQRLAVIANYREENQRLREQVNELLAALKGAQHSLRSYSDASQAGHARTIVSAAIAAAEGRAS